MKILYEPHWNECCTFQAINFNWKFKDIICTDVAYLFICQINIFSGKCHRIPKHTTSTPVSIYVTNASFRLVFYLWHNPEIELFCFIFASNNNSNVFIIFIDVCVKLLSDTMYWFEYRVKWLNIEILRTWHMQHQTVQSECFVCLFVWQSKIFEAFFDIGHTHVKSNVRVFFLLYFITSSF